ncbi:fimbrial protein [Providencia rettgeri]|uniref:fimbrial protein n=1 Tax=Providencia rettgeri TaxID=587 RepID=UPI0018C79DAA|nr:type 1 fimbrial protein [Providencia rettgeri]MBG5929383.1 type 1 fimbrial protein [Providencia rettgeri]
MHKTLLKLTPAALLLIAVANNSHAATNAEITITGNVTAATCDVSLSRTTLDVGNYAPSDFTGVAIPIPASQAKGKFTVGIENCQTPLGIGDTANLIVTGPTLAGNSNIFNNTGTNTGIMLSLSSSPNTYITSGEKLTVATAGDPPAAGDFNGKTLSLTAGLASTSTLAGIDISAVRAPILFSFNYN